MEYFVKICIAFMIILTAFFCLLLFFGIKKAIKTKSLLNQGNRNDHLPFKLLRINFNKRRIMRRVYLPYTEEPDSPLYCVDLLVINHGGILLLSVKNLKGTIENPFRGDWRQFYNSTITQFRNPLEENSIYARALTNLLKNEKVINVPIKSAICYIDAKTKFKNKIEQLIPADKLIPYVKDMAKNRFLSGIEINNTTNLIQKKRKNMNNSGINPPQIKHNISGRVK